MADDVETWDRGSVCSASASRTSFELSKFQGSRIQSSSARLQPQLEDPAATAPPPAAAAPGPKLKELGICVVIGIVVYLLMPTEFASDPINKKAWSLLAIFVGTIMGIILQPLPLGAVAVMGLGITMVTGTLTFQQAFKSMASEVPWLILFAFFFSGGFIKTGLGSRIAYMFVARFGSTTIGLAYALVLAEFLLAPAIPSVSARAGGIFMPIARSISEASGSNVGDGTEKRLGSFLIQACYQCTCVSSAMFLTGAACNPVSCKLGQEITGVPVSWGNWTVAGFLPGIINLAAVPLVVYALAQPEIKRSPRAPETARAMLAQKGPLTKDEVIMGATLMFTVLFWMIGPYIGINAIAAAIMGVSVLLITGVVTWKECLGDNIAWDTLIWFGALIAMASGLEQFGLSAKLSANVKSIMEELMLPWQTSLFILVMCYFYAHYLFASGVAHVLAMYGAFTRVAIGLGAPPMMTVMTFSYLSNLMGGLTHYGSGCAPAFYATGYVSVKDWWTTGFLLSIMNLGIWFVVGSMWWSVLGYLPRTDAAPAADAATNILLQANLTANLKALLV